MKLPNIFKKLEKEIETNPRKCSCCGLVETLDNIILKYHPENVFLCDDCAIKKYGFETFEENYN